MRSATAVDRLVGGILDAITRAPESSQPFRHLRLSGVFPADAYEAILGAMPLARSYRSMSGRSRQLRASDGVPTRTKLDLLPESLRRLPPPQREVWSLVSDALLSPAVRDAFIRRLAPGAGRVYPIPVLARDVSGYGIEVHPDSPRKAITVQVYLPRDESIAHVGTAFHRKDSSGGFEKVVQMPFVPNSGYAFAVGADTFHGVETVGPEVSTRDSILLTYYLDRTLGQRLQNRAKRLGNRLAGSLRALVFLYNSDSSRP